MFDVGVPELLLILVVVLVIFGPGKLPEIGSALGRSLKEFRDATQGEVKKDSSSAVDEQRK